MDRETVDYIEETKQETLSNLEALSFENQAIDSLSDSFESKKSEKRPFLLFFPRWFLFAAIVFCYLLPAFYIFISSPQIASEGIWLLLLLIGFGILFFIVYMWEKKLQYSVTHLVKAKLEKLSQQVPSLEVCEPIQTKSNLGECKEEVAALIYQLTNQENSYQHQIDLLYSSLEKNKTAMHEMSFQLDRKMEELAFARQEAEDVHREYERLKSEQNFFIQENQIQLQHKDSLLQEYLQTIVEQRKVIEKKQQTISRLEKRIQDLMYEVRSLLHFEDSAKMAQSNISHSVEYQPSEEMHLEEWISLSQEEIQQDEIEEQLSRFIHTAQNLTGLSHLANTAGKPSRIMDFTLDNNALDWRGLFDHFREETYVVFFYSPFEEKLLFINGQVKNLLGWNSEKFIKDFYSLVEKGLEEWKLAVSESFFSKKTLELVIRTKEGMERPTQCYLQMIAKGPFSENIIGVLI